MGAGKCTVVAPGGMGTVWAAGQVMCPLARSIVKACFGKRSPFRLVHALVRIATPDVWRSAISGLAR